MVVLQLKYFEARISRSVSESPVGFEITRVDCTLYVQSVVQCVPICVQLFILNVTKFACLFKFLLFFFFFFIVCVFLLFFFFCFFLAMCSLLTTDFGAIVRLPSQHST